MVTAGSLPRYVQGRRATVWLCRVSADGTTLTDPTLLFTGLVGAGVTMVRGGTRWQLTLDPLTEALARAPDLPVELYGWHHLANSSPYDFSLMATVLGGLGPNINGGWSPNLAEVVSKWNEQLQAATSIRIAPANGQLTLTNSAGSPIEVGSILEPRRVMVPANGTASFDSAPDTLLVMEGGI
jgi:hypothetical protein